MAVSPYMPTHGGGKNWFSSLGAASFWAPENIIPMGIGLLQSYFDKPDAMLGPWYETATKAAAERALKTIDRERIYLTIDIDGVDPAYAPAVGNPNL